MPNRIPLTIAAVALMLGLVGPLSACASSAQGSTAASHGTSSPTAVPPIVIVVRLDSAFSPRSLRLGRGQQFLVIVNKAVQVSGPGLPGDCTSGGVSTATTGVLSVRCSAGNYLYTAEHVGSAVVSARVRPLCAPGKICPQWVTNASLKVTVT